MLSPCGMPTCGVSVWVLAAVAGAHHEAHALRLVAPPRLPHNRREVALQQPLLMLQCLAASVDVPYRLSPEFVTMSSGKQCCMWVCSRSTSLCSGSPCNPQTVDL